jgi:predicted nucleotidyltransferase
MVYAGSLKKLREKVKYRYNYAMNGYTEKLDEIIKIIINMAKPSQIILFGSYSNGTFNIDSDMDLLIVYKEKVKPREESNRLRAGLRGLKIPLDLIVASEETIERQKNNPYMIYKHAIEEGKLIYG